MKVSTIFLAFAVAVSAAPLPASAEILQGLRFVTAMKDNTLSGKTAAGTAYNVYFLPGGMATSDAAGTRDNGRWQLDRDGDVCVSWHGTVATSQGCFRVTADGRNLSWEQKSTQTG
jgi:hypothetical protein